ncbi:hypothetical protein K1719_010601 [Acacia pycnantha]|nr:hypothetical protein K1719_010601 [Acacia pycnantha]
MAFSHLSDIPRGTSDDITSWEVTIQRANHVGNLETGPSSLNFLSLFVDFVDSDFVTKKHGGLELYVFFLR